MLGALMGFSVVLSGVGIVVSLFVEEYAKRATIA